MVKRQNEHKKERYWNEPNHREEHLARQREHYKENKDRILKYKSGMRTAKRRNKKRRDEYLQQQRAREQRLSMLGGVIK